MKRIFMSLFMLCCLSVLAPSADAMVNCDSAEPTCDKSITCTSPNICRLQYAASPVCGKTIPEPPEGQINLPPPPDYVYYCGGGSSGYAENTTFSGTRNSQAQSPATGRQRACEAKLDVCFGRGHQEINELGIVDETTCLAACTAQDCESRCLGAFGGQPTCS